MRGVPLALLALLSTACAVDFDRSAVSPPDDAFEDGDTDEITEVVDDTDAGDRTIAEPVPTCDPAGADDHCEVNTLKRCNGEGTGFVEVDCHPGICIEDLYAHCIGMEVSNLDDPSLLCAGTRSLGPLDIPPDKVWIGFDPSSGQITAFDEDLDFLTSTIIRESGLGDIGGIVYSRQEQPGGAPGLGIFSLASFEIPPGVGVLAMGSRAGVILACGPIIVEGILGSPAVPTALLSGFPIPGAAGGTGGQPSDTPDGGGESGGTAGSENSGWSGGGGGGAHGGDGGTGGSLGSATGGSGGTAYGAADLIPLTAGSGGGSGADAWSETCSSEGGSGGGALLVASTVSVHVLPGGSIDVSGSAGHGGMACLSGGGAGGGGGGSGGGLLVEAPEVRIQGYLLASGGGGGAGSPGAGVPGQDGQDGLASVGTARGGVAAGTGTAGGSGSDPASGHAQSGTDGVPFSTYYMGGGGGGSGIIRINGLSIDISSATLHPSPSSGLFSTGDLGFF
jgi:hypothetical protein